MNFLQPQFLYGLFALSIPVIVHLFNFRKAKKVYFTNTAFLQQVQQTSSAKRKLKHYLILLSRLLALFFLIMAFTQPFLPSSEEGLQSKYVVIYLDNSQSMSNLTAQEIKGFDEGVAYVNHLVELHPIETKFILLTNDFSPFSNTFKNGSKISDYLTEAKMSSAIRSFDEVQTRITSTTIANNISDYDIYWISDFQKSTLGEIDDESSDTTHSYHLIPIPFISSKNLYIDSVYLDNPFDIEVNKSKVNVVLRNFGNQAVTEAVLKLYLNDQQISTKAVDIPANTSYVVNFDVIYQATEQNNARLTIDDYPIAFDNNFFFNLNAQQPLNIIEIRGKTDIEAIEKVYGNETLFNYQLMKEGNINYELLKSADLIVLHELSQLSASLANQLYQYKQSGGRLAIIPSDGFQPSEYQLLAGTRIIRKPDTTDQLLLSLQKPDLNHPFYQGIFEQNNADFNMPKVKSTLAWNRLNDLLKDNSGTSYLSYHEDQGISYVFASSLQESHTDLSQQAIFVPIMYKIASYKSRNSRFLYHTLDQQNITLKLDSIGVNEIYKLKNDEQELIPDQSVSGNELLLDLPRNTITPGFMELILGDETKQVLAFNHGNQESNPDQFSIEELETVANSNSQFKLLETTESANFTSEMQERFQGTHLWKYAIAITLLFLFIEIMIIRYYKPTTK